MGISAFILAKNEADCILLCLDSLKWVEQIVVIVDEATTDGTAEICRQAGAEVIVQPWLGFSAQAQLGLDLAQHDWVLRVDADETVSPALRDELLKLVDTQTSYDAFKIPSRNFFWGRELRCLYPNRKVRLFRRGAGYFSAKAVHEEWIPHVATASIGRLKGDFYHDGYRNLPEFVNTMTRYAELAADDILERGPVRSIWPAIGDFLWDFFKYHIIKRGFLDGAAGLTYNLGHAYYMYLRYAIAYERTCRQRKK